MKQTTTVKTQRAVIKPEPVVWKKIGIIKFKWLQFIGRTFVLYNNINGTELVNLYMKGVCIDTQVKFEDDKTVFNRDKAARQLMIRWSIQKTRAYETSK